jgi:predicted deacetylase
MRFAIRDDDTSYFTSPDQLERVYGAIWDDVPVSLAVVPFHATTKSGSVPAELWSGNREYATADNDTLVRYLRDQIRENRVSVLLHGYNHKNYDDGFEFQVGEHLFDRIVKGKFELERLFGVTVQTFVPPHNALSRRGLEAVDQSGLNVLGSFLSFSPKQRPWDRATLGNYLKVWRYRRRTGRGRHDRMVYPAPLRYANHSELGCHALIPGTSLASLTRGFDEARQEGGDFCLATHYWEFDSAMSETLHALLDHARKADATFVHADALFDKAPLQ